MADNKFEFAATLDAVQAADYLSRIAEGLLAGRIGLTGGEKSIELTPGKAVKLEIEAETKTEKSKGSLTVEISWRAKSEVPSALLQVSTAPVEESSAESSEVPTEVGE